MKENNLETTESNFAEIINDIMTGKQSLSYSSLKEFLKSPKHFYAYKMDKSDPTEAMKEGSMFHMACLEPEKFKENYWVLDDSKKVNDLITNGYLDSKGKLTFPKTPRATNVYKDWLQEEISKHSGEMVSQDLYDTFMNMSEALRRNTATKWMFENAVSFEESNKYQYDDFLIHTKLDLKGKTKEFEYIVDLKKVADASFDKIKWDIRKMKYNMQGGMYSHFEGVKEYYLVFIDKGCNITVVRLLPETLEEGFNIFESSLEQFIDCASQDLWHMSYEFYNNGYINF